MLVSVSDLTERSAATLGAAVWFFLRVRTQVIIKFIHVQENTVAVIVLTLK
tara:strand:+ start:169 stop:321 length:153 start_codon:yes stop_codon:yes gene_type:complete